MSEFEIDIRATMDREESRKTSDRLKEQRQREARRGAPMPGGRRPFGFERDGVTINEAEADLIREAVARFLEGETLNGPEPTGKPRGFALRRRTATPRATNGRANQWGR